MLELIQTIVGYAVAILIMIVMIMGIIAGEAEKSERRKNFKAGTHDYYGNKIE